jgi:hypothetical protein
MPYQLHCTFSSPNPAAMSPMTALSKTTSDQATAGMSIRRHKLPTDWSLLPSGNTLGGTGLMGYAGIHPTG